MKLFDFILFYVGLFSLKQTLSFLEDKFLFYRNTQHTDRREEEEKILGKKEGSVFKG
jgi:hypothetical protein